MSSPQQSQRAATAFEGPAQSSALGLMRQRLALQMYR